MTNSDWPDADLQELYGERCGVREHDGQMSREAAERAAVHDVRNLVGRGVKLPVSITDKAKFSKPLEPIPSAGV